MIPRGCEVKRGLAMLVAIVGSRARVEQQDCCVGMALRGGDLQWREAIGWLTQVDVGALFHKPFYGCAPIVTSCVIQARHAITFLALGCHINERVKVAARSVMARCLDDERGFHSQVGLRVDLNKKIKGR